MWGSETIDQYGHRFPRAVLISHQTSVRMTRWVTSKLATVLAFKEVGLYLIDPIILFICCFLFSFSPNFLFPFEFRHSTFPMAYWICSPSPSIREGVDVETLSGTHICDDLWSWEKTMLGTWRRRSLDTYIDSLDMSCGFLGFLTPFWARRPI